MELSGRKRRAHRRRARRTGRRDRRARVRRAGCARLPRRSPGETRRGRAPTPCVAAGLRAASLGADLTDARRGRRARRARARGDGRPRARARAPRRRIRHERPGRRQRSRRVDRASSRSTSRRRTSPRARSCRCCAPRRERSSSSAPRRRCPGARVAGIAAYAAAKSALLTLDAGHRAGGARRTACAPTPSRPPSIRTAANVAEMGADVAYVTREAVADVVVWLCSDGARAVTGQVVRVR